MRLYRLHESIVYLISARLAFVVLSVMVDYWLSCTWLFYLALLLGSLTWLSYLAVILGYCSCFISTLFL